MAAIGGLLGLLAMLAALAFAIKFFRDYRLNIQRRQKAKAKMQAQLPKCDECGQVKGAAHAKAKADYDFSSLKPLLMGLLIAGLGAALAFSFCNASGMGT